MIKYFTPTKLSENIHETPEGYLICMDVPIGRTGTMQYGANEIPLEADDHGQVAVTRDAENLFHPDTISSFEGKPFTINHPKGFVNPENWATLSKGVLQNVRKNEKVDDDGEQSLITNILVTDSLAISLIKQGMREVSCGYEAVYESMGKGKGRQTNIIGNHLALVDQGRAGPAYAIMDHKIERSPMSKMAEKIRSVFAKAADEAVAVADEAKKDDKVPEKAKDADSEWKDAMMKMCQDMSSKIDAMNKGKDADTTSSTSSSGQTLGQSIGYPSDATTSTGTTAAPEETATPQAAAPGMEDRLKTLETAVAKMMEMMSNGNEEEEEVGDADGDDDDSETGDADKDDDDDEAGEKKTGPKRPTGDTASRAEILAPGLKGVGAKEIKRAALEKAYQTKDGKEVIDSLTGGKLTFDSAERVNNLFIASSEILKTKRGVGLAGSLNPGNWDLKKINDSKYETVMTPEEHNKRAAAFWGTK